MNIFEHTSNNILKSFLASENVDILIMGHTYIPYVKKFKNGMVLNPGSVGQPRDGDRRASFAVIDTDKMDVIIHRVQYDIDKVVNAITNAKLPEFLGERLYRSL